MDLKHRVSIHSDRIKKLAKQAEGIEKEVIYRWDHEK
jgi:hypothetical protein